jgi:hypothetical protein
VPGSTPTGLAMENGCLPTRFPVPRRVAPSYMLPSMGMEPTPWCVSPSLLPLSPLRCLLSVVCGPLLCASHLRSFALCQLFAFFVLCQSFAVVCFVPVICLFCFVPVICLFCFVPVICLVAVMCFLGSFERAGRLFWASLLPCANHLRVGGICLLPVNCLVSCNFLLGSFALCPSFVLGPVICLLGACAL